jgi:Tfp pilus assembly protein PilF
VAYGERLATGRRQLDNGQTDAAITSLKAAAQGNPRGHEAMAELGRAYLERGDARRARDVLTQAARMNRRSADPHLYLGGAYQVLNQPAEACRSYARYLALAPGTPRTAEVEAYRQALKCPP